MATNPAHAPAPAEFAHGRHEANAYGKAEEAIAAIEWLIAEQFAGIDNRRSGLHEFRSFLFGEDEEMAGLYWGAVGVAHAALYRDPAKVKLTTFKTSIEFVSRLLTARIDELDAPQPADPFEGLGFEN